MRDLESEPVESTSAVLDDRADQTTSREELTAAECRSPAFTGRGSPVDHGVDIDAGDGR